ncbi:Hypoxanthine-guanine phosphoribosyltransferase [Dyadobacter sp. CECT 9275]|uniref:Hypoxanthine phosphoribosyltransferase n=1 Tax=Dyadobacter helix TaxID=2822344 RepID=A0A916JFI8_9BACT|nr:hypoxanthine phosphoribosyltransferase [Dyadobacter sp. CECT 9275]CAG5010061.1 Hypoxanthine-guanine phosphoribosyltransferase [Dyadobacter sp. CECT 9275]
MITILDKTFVPFISRSNIESRIAEMAVQISKDYEGKSPLFIIVLNGAFLFASELLKNVSLPCQITFVRLASYQQTETTGQVRQIIGLEEQITGKDVVIVEDIVDTGLTMNQLLEQIQALQPASVEIATLLHKPEAIRKPVSMRYIGFEIENRFVVGYGLDYDGLGRNEDALYVLSE